MEASIDASSNPTSGLATCSVIVAVVDPNTSEISGTESLTAKILVYNAVLLHILFYLMDWLESHC